MKYLIASKRFKALIGIGLISKKVINYPAGGFIKGTHELAFNI